MDTHQHHVLPKQIKYIALQQKKIYIYKDRARFSTGKRAADTAGSGRQNGTHSRRYSTQAVAPSALWTTMLSI